MKKIKLNEFEIKLLINLIDGKLLKLKEKSAARTLDEFRIDYENSLKDLREKLSAYKVKGILYETSH